MFDKDLILKQLNEMSSEDVALLVRNVLIESRVEFTQGDTGIIFDGLSSWDHCLFKVSANSGVVEERNIHTGYCSSDVKVGRSTMFQMEVDNRSTDFCADKYVLAAA